ncbi:MAG TPA: carboxypeptidase-like regulatory domain-containing protein [Blastocatellia bacterium]|nr:carboxypeptidase-like regulatory domain-containing protein [Blastocatellia bacterium]
MLRFTRFQILLSIASLFIFSAANAQSPQQDSRPRTSSVSGRVTVAGKPSVNAKVVVTEVKDRPSPESQGFSIAQTGAGTAEDHGALTDAEGRYRVANLPEGKYEAKVSLGGHVREKPSPNESLIESFALGEGESRGNVDFALVRGGVITGRVTDADGRPLIARAVSLQVVDEQGGKTVAPGSRNPMNMMMGFGGSQTDDRGVYRIFGLRAGRYLVSSGGESDVFTGAGGNHPRAWHPDAANENQAKVVEVTSGGEVTGVDIRLGAVKKTYEALGRVVDDETGKPVAGVGVMCIKVKADDGAAIDGVGFGGFGGNLKTDEQGNFRFAGLAPGQYQLNLADYESFLTGGGTYYSDGAKFEIHGGDVAGVEMRAKSGATISGVAVIEDADQSAKSSLSQTMLMAYSSPPSPNEANENAAASLMTPSASRVGSDGAFSLKGLRPGKVTIHAFIVTVGPLKITRIERGGVDMTEGIVLTGREDITGVRVVIEMSKKNREEK